MTRWVYEVQVVGTVSDTVLDRLRDEWGDVRATPEPVCTLIRGELPDQSALVGLLDGMHALGLNVHELRRVAERDDDDAQQQQSQEVES